MIPNVPEATVMAITKTEASVLADKLARASHRFSVEHDEGWCDSTTLGEFSGLWCDAVNAANGHATWLTGAPVSW